MALNRKVYSRVSQTHSSNRLRQAMAVSRSLTIMLGVLPLCFSTIAVSVRSQEAPTSGASPLSAPAQDATCQAQAPKPKLVTDQPHISSHLQPVLADWMKTAEPDLVAHLSQRPFPEIHDRARLAKVPILMYHDVLPKKEVFFDVTPAEFEQHLQWIKTSGATPISMDDLTRHLSTGMPLPEKPVLLTFDDGYRGHYEHVYPLLKKYQYPAVFGIYTAKVGTNVGRSSVTWEQLREMAADPLVTIASHSVTHPLDLRGLPSQRLRHEIVESKRILQEQLGIPINYFVYPVGLYDEAVKRWVQQAGYKAALTMNDAVKKVAGESESLLTIERMGQSTIKDAIANAWGGPPLPALGRSFNFSVPIRVNRTAIDTTSLILISGGKPVTIHADSRYQVEQIISKTDAVAAVDGGFFSLKYLDSNTMIGPVLSQSNGKFIPGYKGELPILKGRPLVVISEDTVQFAPFDPNQHNTLKGIQTIDAKATDAFVAAAWLVKDGTPRTRETFGALYGFDAPRHRAFWGIDFAGQPVIGVSTNRVDSVTLGQALSRAGLREAVMLDSGASAALAYQGESLVSSYEPRPVPHVVALMPPAIAKIDPSCLLAYLKRLE